MDFKQKFKDLVITCNNSGIPIPLLRDPKTGPSVSLTLMFIAFNVTLAGLLTKWAGFLGGVDVNQAQELFYGTAALYFGRKITSKNNQIIESEKKES
jgi:hypothetical protein